MLFFTTVQSASELGFLKHLLELNLSSDRIPQFLTVDPFPDFWLTIYFIHLVVVHVGLFISHVKLLIISVGHLIVSLSC